jgi:hypothetical protein
MEEDVLEMAPGVVVESTVKARGIVVRWVSGC